MSQGSHRLAIWLLTRYSVDSWRESFIGDLIEQYEERGAWWYWRQILGAVRTHVAGLLLTATQTRVPAVQCAEYICDVVLWILLGACGLIQVPLYTALFIGRMPLTKFEGSLLIAVSILVGASLIGAAIAVREIRIRMAPRDRTPRFVVRERTVVRGGSGSPLDRSRLS